MTVWPLDHIAVLARTLEEGAAHVAECLGIDMPVGGKHPAMGTHNLLLSLGPACYLEVIAVDPDAPKPGRPRWFGLDAFDEAPRLGTWILATDDLEDSLAATGGQSGEATDLSRGDLRWRISVRPDGSLPMGGAFPSFIAWPGGISPAGRMVDLGCRMRRVTIRHPDGAGIRASLDGRLDGRVIDIREDDARSMEADIETPDGVRRLI